MNKTDSPESCLNTHLSEKEATKNGPYCSKALRRSVCFDLNSDLKKVHNKVFFLIHVFVLCFTIRILSTVTFKLLPEQMSGHVFFPKH